MINDCFTHDKDRLLHHDAIELLQSRLSPIASTIKISLEQANGKILARDISAPRNIPAFDNSAVDGYAFKCDAHSEIGGFFAITGRIAAGDSQRIEVPNTGAARIFTGAIMPIGADSVAMQEDCETHEQDGSKFVIIPQGLIKGANVRLAGEDIRCDEILIHAGKKLRAQDIAAIASCGYGHVEIFAPLKVAIASTGREIVRPGNELDNASVYDANFFMINSLLQSLNVEIKDLGILPDDRQVVEDCLRHAAMSHDIVITSGGASLGAEDHITKILTEVGTRQMWQLAIKPGRPMCFGTLDETIFFGLPGNPVASFVCFLLYIRPCLISLGGGGWVEPRRYQIPSGIIFENKKPDRREFWRGYLATDEEGKICLKKYDRDGSGLISGLRAADGFIEIGETVTQINPGDLLDFIPFSEFGI